MMVVFEKGKTLRYIGHLDLMRAMQRALRRSGLPIRYSNGFNPHIRLSFAAPLSVGQFFLMDLVSMIPLLNIVLLLVWSFADNTNPNRRNLARARLIWVAIGIVCSILLLLIAIWAMSNTYWYLRY